MANYHDDTGDYTSNECTMDGTACLVYYLSEMAVPENINIVMNRGAVVRMDTTKKDIWLCFSAHDLKDGFETVLNTLDRHKVRASFFVTGDFCRDNPEILKELVSRKHYIGPHSDKHLLYCSWENRDSLLVTRDEFMNDIENNYKALMRAGISRDDASVFLPPYEWHNDAIAEWCREAGIRLINISSGALTNQDWTYPREDGPYFSSDTIMKTMVSFEQRKGMNGYILLIHPGTDPRRTDKFYNRLDEVLSYLEKNNYRIMAF
jgi:peptidoglycan/xylan/chitin deacetylase (PgdA/CDA1 family)